MMRKIINAINARGGIGLLAFAVAMWLYGGTKPDTPPVVTEQGIKLTSFKVGGAEGGLTLKWETSDERIVDGDTFIVKCRDRQIPARKGWSAWREIGRTTETEFSTGGFWRDRDIMIRIEVDKGAIE